MSRTTDRTTIRNPSDQPLTLILEPWAFEYDLQPGGELVVEGEGPLADRGLSTTYEGEFVTVCAWDGADVRVLNTDGTIQADWTGLRMPTP